MMCFQSINRVGFVKTRRPSFLALLFFLAASAMPAGEPDKLVLPGQYLLDADQGTVEFWIRFHFDPDNPGQRGSRGNPFYFDFGDAARPSDGFSLLVRNDSNRPTWMRGVITVNGARLVNNVIVNFGNVEARGDGWYHYAFAWNRKEGRVWSWVNGRPAGAREMFGDNPFYPEIMADARLYIGSAPGESVLCDFTLAEFRVSSIQRAPEELGFHAEGPLEPDPFTLLLIDFQPEDDGRAIRPRAAATPQADRTYRLPAPYRVVESPFGFALRMDGNE